MRELGLSDATISRAVVAARLFPVFRGTFAVGHAGVGRGGRLLAATLVCGDGCVVSHGTAAALLGLWKRYPPLVDVIASSQAGCRVAGIRRHYTPLPAPVDRVVVDRIPCAGPSQVIVEVAGIVGEASLRRTIEQAAVLRLLDLERIDAILAGPRRRGSRRLRSVLEDWHGYVPGTRLRSPLEAKLLQLVTARRMPRPECNVEVWAEGEKFEVDFLWRRERVVVETDGGRFHDNPQAEARDRRRDSLLMTAGYRVHRLRWYDLEERPEAAMHEIAGLLRLGQGRD